MKTMRTLSEVISAGFFVITIVSILLQVIFRYVLNWPLAWTSEVALNAFLVGSWWTICWNLALNEHVTLNIVFNALPKRLQRVSRVLGGAFAGSMLFLAVPASVKYIEVVNRMTTGVLKIPLSWIYGIFTVFLVVVGIRLLLDAGFALVGRAERMPSK